MSTLLEIERAAEALPQDQQERLFEWLSARVRTRQRNGRPPRSVLDIAPVSVGAIIRPLESDDDVLGEMLEGRARRLT
jgi:hypothetical protein